MDNVGLRPPQFSEDLAWLPAWVQQHHMGSSVEQAKEPQMNSVQDPKDMTLLQGNVSEEKDVDILLKEEAANRCHLFFSGGDSSPISTTHHSGTVLHLSLRLSQTGNSQYSQTPAYLSQALRDSGKALSVQHVESSPAHRQKTSQPKMDFTSDEINSSPLTSISRSMKTDEPQCFSKNCCGRGYDEISTFGIPKVADVKCAVDLLVAASEALAILNLTRGKSASEGLPTSPVLEAALKVKQARLEGFAATFACETNEIDEIDSLSDLDDFTMADALEDVGLCLDCTDGIHICGSDTSHVKDTPMSENHDGCNKDSKDIEHMAQPLELPDHQALGLRVSEVAIPNDPMSLQPVNIITDDEKLIETSAKLKKDITKSIFNAFVGETSFLSESADVAPDENSFVQHGSRNENASLSSVPYEGLYEKTKVWNSNSQGIARSNLSSDIDPLCSVVPCSISLENTGFPQFQNLSDREVNAERYSCPTSEFVSDRVVGRYNEENCEKIGMGNQFFERTHYESRYHEPAEVDIELHAMPSIQNRSPVNLNQSMCSCARASMCCIHTTRDKILEDTLAQKTMATHNQSETLLKNLSRFNNPQDIQVSATKRVHFSKVEIEPLNNIPSKQHSSHQSGSTGRASKSLKHCVKQLENRNHKTNNCLISCREERKRLIFQDIEFLLTGFSNEKQKEIERLVRKYGGVVLLDIPSPSNSRTKRSSTSCSRQLPVVLSSKKLKTTKFLYGCAVNALILKVKWLTDSIAAGFVKPPDKYMVLPNQAGRECSNSGMSVCLSNYKYIFNGVGVMLHGKHSFCAKLAMIIKHGGGQVFKTLHGLVLRLDSGKVSMGAIAVEDESRVSRHLRHCAFERKIPIMSASWIVKSLHLGIVTPVTAEKHRPLPMTRIPKFPISLDWSQEI